MRATGLQRRARSGASAKAALAAVIARIAEPYRTLLLLAEVCGVPRSALAERTLGDVQLGDDVRLVYADWDAGGALVEVALSPAAVAVLAAYLTGWRAAHTSGPGHLFPQPRHPDEPVSLAIAKRVLRRAQREASAASPRHLF